MATQDIHESAADFKATLDKKDCKNCKWTYPDGGSSKMSSSEQDAVPGLQAGAAGLLQCPPDYNELGRHTWTYLHTLAMYYPDKASEDMQNNMEQHLDTFSKLYPCSPCAVHMREYVKDNPFQLDSRYNFSMWMCNFHNDVNRITRKAQFDCRRLIDRWALPPPSKCLLEREPTYDIFVDVTDDDLDDDNVELVDDDDGSNEAEDDPLYA